MSSVAAVFAEKYFIRIPLEFNLPLQVCRPYIPIRGPESFPLIVAGAIGRHFAGPVPAYIIYRFAFVLIDTAPTDLHKWVIFTQWPGYHKTFLFGAVLVFNGRPVKVCPTHGPVQGRFCFSLATGLSTKSMSKMPLSFSSFTRSFCQSSVLLHR